MTDEHYNGDEHEDYTSISELMEYTRGQVDAEKDHATERYDRYAIFADIAEESRTTYELGYIAGYRNASGGSARMIPRAITEHAIYGDDDVQQCARVYFTDPAHFEGDQSVETSAHIDRAGKIIVDDIYKVYADGRRESIAFTQEGATSGRLAQRVHNLRERFNKWRQLFGSSD